MVFLFRGLFFFFEIKCKIKPLAQAFISLLQECAGTRAEQQLLPCPGHGQGPVVQLQCGFIPGPSQAIKGQSSRCAAGNVGNVIYLFCFDAATTAAKKKK